MIFLRFLHVATLISFTKSLSCSEFDPSKITLVTFDVFAALMDTPTSLTKSVSFILPRLSPPEVDQFVNSWLSAYGSYAGTVFNESVTGQQPFQWMLNTTLIQIDHDMSLNLTSEESGALVAAWGDLIPWPATTETLTQIYSANFSVAPLSNGDSGTLANAVSVFYPSVVMSYIFSSDFPSAGSFKPNYRMYEQVLAGSGRDIHQVLHVAGAPQDAYGARDYGLFSALVYNKPIPGPNKPCFVFQNITELTAVLLPSLHRQ